MKKLEANTRAVYTVLFGDYEELNEVRIPLEFNIDYICFTDNAELKSDTWDVQLISPEFPMDLVRSQRLIKIMGHQNLTKYKETLYLDNSVILRKPASMFFDMLLSSQDIGMPLHSFRRDVFEEFEEVSRLEYDSPLRLEEQLQHYKVSYRETLGLPPLWTAIIARRSSEKTELFQRIWANQILRYSRRDQLSVRVAQQISGIEIHEQQLNNTGSEIHDWPVTRKRSDVPSFEIESNNSELQLLTSSLKKLKEAHSQLKGSYEQLEISFERAKSDQNDSEQQLASVLESHSWKITAPMRCIKKKIKGVNTFLFK